MPTTTRTATGTGNTMTKINYTDTADKIILGIVPAGSRVKIIDSADARFPHPFAGTIVTVGENTGAVGGIGGGGAVKIILPTGTPSWDSRYTRVIIVN